MRELIRETRGLKPGALSRAGTAFLLEEGDLRSVTVHADVDVTRALPADAMGAHLDEFGADLMRKQVHFVARKDRRAGEVTVGRLKQCDVTLPLASVSSRHCTLTLGRDGWAIRDLGSRNGTYVDGERLEKDKLRLLRSGAVIRVGAELKLTFLEPRAMENLLIQLDPILREEAQAAAFTKGNVDTRWSSLFGDTAARPDYLAEDDKPRPPEEGVASPASTRSDLAEKVKDIIARAKAVDPAAHAPPAPPAPSPVTLPARRPAPPAARDSEAILSLVCPPFAPVALVNGVAVTVGRVAGNELVLPHAHVSRQHARFVRQGAAVIVTDLGSANGTWLRDKRVNGASLAAGDEVVIGPYRLKVASETASPA